MNYCLEPPALPSSCLAKDITQYQLVVGETKMSPSRAWGKICVPKQELGNEEKNANLGAVLNQPASAKLAWTCSFHLRIWTDDRFPCSAPR
jgi:hypothetical protein